MTTFLEKLGTQAENVYQATNSWTQSFYSAVTDNAVLPASKWIWTKLESQSSVGYIPPKVKKIFQTKSLYKVCQDVKRASGPKAHAEPFKIQNLEQYNCLGRMMGYNLEGTDKVIIQASRCIYVIADVGEKTMAVGLFAEEMAPQLRPSLNQHFVKPVFADLNHLIAGPKKDPADLGELISYSARSIGGAVVEEKGAAFVDTYLADKEKQIAIRVTKIEDETKVQAISWFSNTVLREGLNTFVTPAAVSGVLSLTGYVVEIVSVTTLAQSAGGYLETVSTTAYVLSYLKYTNYFMWAVKAGRSIYQLYQSYTPEFTDKAIELLRKSFNRPAELNQENSFDPAKQIREYAAVIAAECDLAGLPGKMIEKTGLSPLINSASLQNLQKHAQNFTTDIKAKSEVALRKYDLIDDVFYDAVEDFPDDDIFYECDEAAFLASTEPKVVTRDEAAAAILSITGLDRTPSTPIEAAVSNAVQSVVRESLARLENAVASAPVTPLPALSGSKALTDSKKADDTEQTPPPKLNWFRRMAITVSKVASVILTFLRNLPPSFFSRFSGIFRGNPHATRLFRYFTSRG